MEIGSLPSGSTGTGPKAGGQGLWIIAGLVLENRPAPQGTRSHGHCRCQEAQPSSEREWVTRGLRAAPPSCSLEGGRTSGQGWSLLLRFQAKLHNSSSCPHHPLLPPSHQSPHLPGSRASPNSGQLAAPGQRLPSPLTEKQVRGDVACLPQVLSPSSLLAAGPIPCPLPHFPGFSTYQSDHKHTSYPRVPREHSFPQLIIRPFINSLFPSPSWPISPFPTTTCQGPGDLKKERGKPESSKYSGNPGWVPGGVEVIGNSRCRPSLAVMVLTARQGLC